MENNKTKLVALKDFSPDGSRRIRKNEVFEFGPESAAKLLCALKFAKIAPDDEDPKRSHLYKRRDMKAEDLT